MLDCGFQSILGRQESGTKNSLVAKHSICAERGALTPSQASPHISPATMVSVRLVVKPGSQRNPGNNTCAAGVGQESVAERTTRCQSHGGAHKRKMSGPGKSSTISRADAAGNASSKCKSVHSISSKFVLGRTKMEDDYVGRTVYWNLWPLPSANFHYGGAMDAKYIEVISESR